MTVVVGDYGDLIGDEFLNVSRADAVARELAANHDLVAYAPSWLVGEKDYPSSDYDDEVVAGTVDHETEKAYLLVCDGAEAWFPKSMIRVYEAGDGAEFVQTTQNGGEGGRTA